MMKSISFKSHVQTRIERQSKVGHVVEKLFNSAYKQTPSMRNVFIGDKVEFVQKSKYKESA